MQFLVFCLIVFGLVLWRSSSLTSWPAAPDLPLAFAAWTIIACDDRGLLLRVWLIGLVANLLAPGDRGFGFLFYASATLLLLPLRTYLFARLPGSWAIACGILVIWRVALAGLLHGTSPPLDLTWFVGAVHTIVAAVLIGWLADALPERLHPLGRLRA